jgi:hypothetical protein
MVNGYNWDCSKGMNVATLSKILVDLHILKEYKSVRKIVNWILNIKEKYKRKNKYIENMYINYFDYKYDYISIEFPIEAIRFLLKERGIYNKKLNKIIKRYFRIGEKYKYKNIAKPIYFYHTSTGKLEKVVMDYQMTYDYMNRGANE